MASQPNLFPTILETGNRAFWKTDILDHIILVSFTICSNETFLFMNDTFKYIYDSIYLSILLLRT